MIFWPTCGRPPSVGILIITAGRGAPLRAQARHINETEQNARLNEARVKFITGHDIITARNLYEEPFDHADPQDDPDHKPQAIVLCTHEGIWRRIHLIPFVPPGDRDKNFRERMLMPEPPNWTLKGLAAYQRQGDVERIGQ